MYRTSGIVVLLLGGLLTWSIVFTPFDQEVRRWTRTEDGGRVKATVACPDPYSILLEDAVNADISPFREPELLLAHRPTAHDRRRPGRLAGAGFGHQRDSARKTAADQTHQASVGGDRRPSAL